MRKKKTYLILNYFLRICGMDGSCVLDIDAEDIWWTLEVEVLVL